VEDVLEIEGVAQIFYDRIEARCKGNKDICSVQSNDSQQQGG
jgi:hypothetical protein